MNGNLEKMLVKNENVEISCELHKPFSNESFPVIVAVHAAGLPHKNDFIYRHLVNCLIPLGVGVCCFDRRGSGESSGDFESADFQDLAGDVVSIMNELNSRNEVSKIGLWGISQGGWIAPLASTISEICSFMVLVSSTPFSVSEQMNYSTIFAMKESGFSKSDIEDAVKLRDQVKEYFIGKVSFKKIQVDIENSRSEQWFEASGVPPAEYLPDDPKSTKWYQEIKFNPEQTIKSVKVPTLLLYAETDPWIDVNESIAYWRRESKVERDEMLKIVRVQDATHFMTKLSEVGVMGSEGSIEEEYSKVLADWVKKQL